MPLRLPPPTHPPRHNQDGAVREALFVDSCSIEAFFSRYQSDAMFVIGMATAIHTQIDGGSSGSRSNTSISCARLLECAAAVTRTRRDSRPAAGALIIMTISPPPFSNFSHPRPPPQLVCTSQLYRVFERC